MVERGLSLDIMRAERWQRLRDQMVGQGLDGLLLLGVANQAYAGVRRPCDEAMRLHYEPTIVLVTARDVPPFVWTATREGLPPEIPDHHIGPTLHVEYDLGVKALARAVKDAAPGLRKLGIDEMTGPMMLLLGQLLPSVEIVDGTGAIGAARLIKTFDEVLCLQQAQGLNERAMYDVQAALRPGIRQNELTALFMHRAFSLGAEDSTIDPIWNLTPRTIAEASITCNSDVGFPVASNDRILRERDLILSDTSITWNGYHSDFGKTWICSLAPRPDPALRDCYLRWQALIARVYEAIRPGATCGDLVRAAAQIETKHALKHFYLGHGIGCAAGEPPFIGSDLGLAFDDQVPLVPGMVFVLEPIIWRDGVGGYRSEELIHVTPTGYERLSRYGYAPFE